MTIAERVGRRLRFAREKRGLTRAVAAALSGKEMSTIRRYETGASQPDWDTLFALCRFYGVRARDVVDPAAKQAVRRKPKQPKQLTAA